MTSGGMGLTEGLGQDISQEELDFSDLFLYNPPGEDFPADCDKDDPGAVHQDDTHPPLLVVGHPAGYISSSEPSASSHLPSSHSPATHNLAGVGTGFESLGLISRPGTIPASSPRIEITPSGDSLNSQRLELSPSCKALGPYRETTPCVSPASSNSSTGWPAEACSPLASPCVSPCGGGIGMGLSALDLGPGIQGGLPSSVHSSPGASPRTSITDETFLLPQHQRTVSPLPHQRSRSASPKVKRTYDQYDSPSMGGTPVKLRSRSPSPIPSPQDQQGSYYLPHYQAQVEPQHLAQASPALDEMLSSLSSGLPRVMSSSKMVRGVYGQDCVYGEGHDWVAEQDRIGTAGAKVKSETFYMLPSAWPHPTHHGVFSSSIPVAPLPSLEWALPSQSGQYELLIQQQPRSHHRAHYETEGSRGAVKTPIGGHPEVQLLGYQGSAPLGLQVFIGTADERLLKPHAFYQVHRITGKTVTTPSMERMISGTKVLEIPLEPKNHMRAVIDCAGILKLRNADIELRNGETDIGRKNTRVRLVFRVHVPQPGGQFVSLQVASHPIECSQRSAQELPAVERQDLDRCSVLGGQQMVLTGQNFTSDSKVMFSEKTQDGQQIWEVEATVDRDKTQPNMLFAEVPPYRDPTICRPAKVNFYVINGKKKRSQPQHFIYTPLIAIKAEPLDDYQLDMYGCLDSQPPGLSMNSFYRHLERDSDPHALSVSPTLYHLGSADPRAHGITPPSLDDQAVYYQSRASSLINSPALFHSPNQRHGNSGASLLSGALMVSHLSSASASTVDSFEAGLVPRQQGYVQATLPLGKSPPSRYNQGQTPGKPGCRADPGVQPLTQKVSAVSGRVDLIPERVTIKQENLHHTYLEDVNDIIRRDLKGHNGE